MLRYRTSMISHGPCWVILPISGSPPYVVELRSSVRDPRGLQQAVEDFLVSFRAQRLGVSVDLWRLWRYLSHGKLWEMEVKPGVTMCYLYVKQDFLGGVRHCLDMFGTDQLSYSVILRWKKTDPDDSEMTTLCFFREDSKM